MVRRRIFAATILALGLFPTAERLSADTRADAYAKRAEPPMALVPKSTVSLNDDYERQALHLSEWIPFWDLGFFFGGTAIKAFGSPGLSRGGQDIDLDQALIQLRNEDSADLARRMEWGHKISVAAGWANLVGMGLGLAAFGEGQCCGVRDVPWVQPVSNVAVALWLGAPLLDLLAHYGFTAPAVHQQRTRLVGRLDPRLEGRQMSAWEPFWRSALFPGWGQGYNGRPVKGWILAGITATSIFYVWLSYGQNPDVADSYLKIIAVTYAFSLFDSVTDLGEFGTYGLRPEGWAGMKPDGTMVAGLRWDL